MLKNIRLFSIIAVIVILSAFSGAQTAAKDAPKPAPSQSAEILTA
jgi:hypothetical protein